VYDDDDDDDVVVVAVGWRVKIAVNRIIFTRPRRRVCWRREGEKKQSHFPVRRTVAAATATTPYV